MIGVAVAGLVVCGAFLFVQTMSLRKVVATIAEENVRVTVVNADGSVAYDSEGASENHANREEIVKARAEGKAIVTRDSETLGAYLIYSARKVGDKVVRLAIPYRSAMEPIHLAKTGLVSAALLGGIAVFLIVLLSLKISRRIGEQTRALETARANENFRREFTANVTHELKTPLTAILGAVEMLGDGEGLAEEERKELFGIVREQAGRLNSLSRDVLALAQIEREQGEPRARFSPVPLHELIATVAALETPRAKEAGASLTVAQNDAITIQGDAQLLEQAVVNLVENALRYSGSDRIEITSAKIENGVEISVTDYGIGIPAEHHSHLFERFYRVDKARSRALGGTGLGLAIVKHIALLHGGSVSVASSPAERTTFTMRIAV